MILKVLSNRFNLFNLKKNYYCELRAHGKIDKENVKYILMTDSSIYSLVVLAGRNDFGQFTVEHVALLQERSCPEADPRDYTNKFEYQRYNKTFKSLPTFSSYHPINLGECFANWWPSVWT